MTSKKAKNKKTPSSPSPLWPLADAGPTQRQSTDPLVNKQNERSPSYRSLDIRPLGFQASFAHCF